MTPAELELLQHALGRDEYGLIRHGSTRNYFVSNHDDTVALSLVAQGFLTSGRPVGFLPKNERHFTVTEAGRVAMLKNSPKPPKLSRSQIRYRNWLSYADAFGGTFGDWLKLPRAEGGPR